MHLGLALKRPFQCVVALAVWAMPNFLVADETPREVLMPSVYRPLDREFWGKVDTLLKEEQALKVFKLKFPEAGTAAEKDEWRLAMARALEASEHRLHAQFLLTQVAAKSIGTRQGAEALRMLHEIAKRGEIDETYLEDFAFDLDTKIDEPESRSMVAYFRARALMKKGYEDWSLNSLSEIVPGSTWGQELLFDRTQQALLAGDSATAYSQFEAVMNHAATRVSTARQARLAVARLNFERRDYKAAIGSYLSIDLPVRERARSLHELAWSYYYDRAFGKALGAIRALKSRYFSVLLSPETYLLELLVYRELCHFKRVKELAGEFVSAYQPVFAAIETRQPVEKAHQFLQILLQEGVMQRRAQAIQQIRIERRTLEKLKWADSEIKEALVALGGKRERIIDAEITRMLRTRTEAAANWFLDLREQVWFLEYEASMRMIQLNEENAEQYEPPKPSTFKPDVIFWPTTQEAWRDELYDYENLVGDACQSSPLMRLSPGGGRGAK